MSSVAGRSSVEPLGVGGGVSVLERNLRALERTSARVVERLRMTLPRTDVQWVVTEDGAEYVSAVMPDVAGGGAGRALCSKRRPREEAVRLAETVDLREAGAVVVLGFGVGHHVRAVAERMKRTGFIVVFEPDLAVLRAVLERVDCSGWLSTSNVAVLCDPGDAAAISGVIQGVEGIAALGVKRLEHPPSMARLGGRADEFWGCVTEVVRGLRTVIVTTLVQTEATCRNLLMNVDHYATAPGVAELAGVGRGRAAVVVSAGPSLERNIELLSRPGVRERVVIVAVQTVLKQLLARGIRPHFVTALDHHEISRRFYEGLTAEDVRGVTLVAEPKANPAILDAYPGLIRCPSDRFLDELLADGRDRGTLPAGATVAHLAYYLSRHLGCDPVILIGQDLGFTDGQYYSAGAAIHETWACELNPFNTLEMMEWQRIVRMRGFLHKATDVLGRPIYTDEQMASYLVQFERDFGADAAAGKRVIDATEGGVSKRHTEAMPLERALGLYVGPGAERVELPAGEDGRARRGAVLPGAARRVQDVRQQVWRVRQACEATEKLLGEMIERHGDQAAVNRLIARVHAQRDVVTGPEVRTGFGLVQYLNQTGGLKRVKADRELALEEGLSAVERQKRQIQRDLTNVKWLGDAAEQLGSMLDASVAALPSEAGGSGKAKLTRDPRGEEPGVKVGESAAAVKVAALMVVDAQVSGLGWERDLGEVFAGGKNALVWTLERLWASGAVDRAVLLAREPGRVRELAKGAAVGCAVEVVDVSGEWGSWSARREAVRGARAWSSSCWRGGLGSMTVYDEALWPKAMSRVMGERGIGAAVVVGADWALVDPGLVAGVVRRHGEEPEKLRLTFTQAPPGVGACVVARSLMEELASNEAGAGSFATVGGLLGYVPVAPQADAIAKTPCVGVEPAVRNVPVRCIPDSGPRLQMLSARVGSEDVKALSAARIAELVTGAAPRIEDAEARLNAGVAGWNAGVPQQVVLELCTGRRTSGVAGRLGVFEGGTGSGQEERPERGALEVGLGLRVIEELSSGPRGRRDAALTLGGAGDPLLHAEWSRFVRAAKRAGIAVHVRTDLLCGEDEVRELIASGADVISVNVMAASAEGYRRLMGVDAYERVVANVELLLELRRGEGVRVPWVVPRMTRCDAAYEEVEGFYDGWLMRAGAAVIDPLPRAVKGERIAPLPMPGWARRWDGRRRMLILSDGSVPVWEDDLSGEKTVGRAGQKALWELWRDVRRERERRWSSGAAASVVAP